ncbi:hypothetical protein L6164_014154 [Bauhinia variegata]|uniref:Uncharacterized protein n=1 Tax=Bauhinia variegata TaxID=167791 RepID=A0ACB9NHN6_BAUVA|nr:hypothetical protein L6164_014154 [Bauhinia variegata]
MNPSPTTYRILIKGLVDNKKMERALEMKEEMDTKRFAPDPIVYHYLMLGHARNSDPDGIFKLYEDLKGNWEKEDLKRQWKFSDKMGEYRRSPDILSFNNLIEQLCNNGLLAEAEEIYGEMDGKGVNPDEFTYGLLMDTCFKENRPDAAAAYFRKMVE